MQLQDIPLHLHALSVLRSIGKTRCVELWARTLSALQTHACDFADCYGALCENTYRNQGLTGEIWNAIRFGENALTEQLMSASPELLSAVTHDLHTINALICLSGVDLKQAACSAFAPNEAFFRSLPDFPAASPLPVTTGEALQHYYIENGFGPFAQAVAFTVDTAGSIVPIAHADPIALTDLPGYALQKEKILLNTRSFLAGRTANNILLYGDKGTGKSSTIKAVVNAYADEGLKIIQLSPRAIPVFPRICELVRSTPFRFILFLDDLSFDREDENFAGLKAFIEGGVTHKPENMLLYATSNRRHLVRESFADRQGDDIHVRDSLETVTSLSDRFGLEITFSVPDKDEFLFIIDTLADEAGLSIGKPELHLFAERFALRRNGRSPRVARQCIRQLEAEQLKNAKSN